MNDLAYRLTLQKQIRRKFYGHDNLKSKHVPQYAISAERQYSQTFANLYRRFDKVVLRWLPKILRTIRQEQEGRQHTDDAIGILQLIDLYLSKMMEDLKKRRNRTTPSSRSKPQRCLFATWSTADGSRRSSGRWE